LSLVVAFGRMLGKPREAAAVYGVMLTLFVALLINAVVFESKPNPALLARAKYTEARDKITLPALPQLPVDAGDMGNLEGKDLRFGPSAAPTFVTTTTMVTCGSVNCMHDSLNPLTGVTPLSGMWLNCVFGGKGVGLVNFVVYLCVAVFLSGLMVGRTPEYLGKKLEAREMKLAMLALLIHPVLILGPSALACVTDWGKGGPTNPGAHGFSQVLYEFSSAAANNGSGFEGLKDRHGFGEAQRPAASG